MPKSVGQTFLSIGAVCVCVAVMVNRSGLTLILPRNRRPTSRVISSGTHKLSTAIKRAGPSALSGNAMAFAQILWVTPSDSVPYGQQAHWRKASQGRVWSLWLRASAPESPPTPQQERLARCQQQSQHQ